MSSGERDVIYFYEENILHEYSLLHSKSDLWGPIFVESANLSNKS